MLLKSALKLSQSFRADMAAICIGSWDYNLFPRSKREVNWLVR